MSPERSGQVKNDNSKLVAWLLFLFMFFAALMKDGNVLILSIPNFNELEVYEGELFNLKGKRNSFVAIKDGHETIKFSCRIVSSGRTNCLNPEDYNFFVGKQVKIYSYNTSIDLFFTHNRLMQLELKDRVILSYEDQKKKYTNAKKNHVYTQSIFCLGAFIWLIFVYRRNNGKQSMTTSQMSGD